MKKDEFLRIARGKINRDGLEELLNWLESTDFFEAPSNTSHDGNHPGFLMQHSMNVYHLLSESPFVRQFSDESIAIVSLFHDVCKVGLYRQVIDEKSGKLVGYEHAKNDLPIGHGEKSVYLLQQFIKLTKDEVIAISWHMGAFDKRFAGGSKDLDEAYIMSNLAVELHLADMRATYILDK